MCFYLRLLKPLIDPFERERSFEDYTQVFRRSSILHRFAVSASADALQLAPSHLAALTGVHHGRAPRPSLWVGFHF